VHQKEKKHVQYNYRHVKAYNFLLAQNSSRKGKK
jgi:hypothetical protein